VDALLDTCTFATLLLVDPQDDWEEALQRIYVAVRAPRASTARVASRRDGT
jgi:hypothetical protein